MLESLFGTSQTPQNTAHAAPRRVLHMVENDRMGGSVPAWKTVKTPETFSSVEASLANALNTEQGLPDTALAYNAPSPQTDNTAKPFGFGDLIDMVNPLHHIPVVNTAYQEISGDEIRPIGQIVGGAVFGGPIGAAASLINVIIEQETGKDITENAITAIFGGHDSKPQIDQPEIQLAAVQEFSTKRENYAEETLPGTVLAISDLTAPQRIIIERIADEEHGRNKAPKINHYAHLNG